MTFKEAISLCTSKDHVVICKCTTKEEWHELIKLIGTKRNAVWSFKERKGADIFYYYPVTTNYGHFNYTALLEENRIIHRFSISKIKPLLDHVRTLK